MMEVPPFVIERRELQKASNEFFKSVGFMLNATAFAKATQDFFNRDWDGIQYFEPKVKGGKDKEDDMQPAAGAEAEKAVETSEPAIVQKGTGVEPTIKEGDLGKVGVRGTGLAEERGIRKELPSDLRETQVFWGLTRLPPLRRQEVKTVRSSLDLLQEQLLSFRVAERRNQFNVKVVSTDQHVRVLSWLSPTCDLEAAKTQSVAPSTISITHVGRGICTGLCAINPHYVVVPVHTGVLDQTPHSDTARRHSMEASPSLTADTPLGDTVSLSRSALQSERVYAAPASSSDTGAKVDCKPSSSLSLVDLNSGQVLVERNVSETPIRDDVKASLVRGRDTRLEGKSEKVVVAWSSHDTTLINLSLFFEGQYFHTHRVWPKKGYRMTLRFFDSAEVYPNTTQVALLATHDGHAYYTTFVVDLSPANEAQLTEPIWIPSQFDPQNLPEDGPMDEQLLVDLSTEELLGAMDLFAALGRLACYGQCASLCGRTAEFADIVRQSFLTDWLIQVESELSPSEPGVVADQSPPPWRLSMKADMDDEYVRPLKTDDLQPVTNGIDEERRGTAEERRRTAEEKWRTAEEKSRTTEEKQSTGARRRRRRPLVRTCWDAGLLSVMGVSPFDLLDLYWRDALQWSESQIEILRSFLVAMRLPRETLVTTADDLSKQVCVLLQSDDLLNRARDNVGVSLYLSTLDTFTTFLTLKLTA